MEQSQTTMDKKNQSRPPLLCKNNQDPSKSDYSTKKNGSQYPRKRENEKSDNGKRSSTAANRGGRSGQRYVRPREKMGGQVENKESLSEFGSVQRSGGKKQDITHLLSYNWAPGSERRSNEYNRACGYRGRKHYVHPVKYNKEHYLQANCQFIVSAGHDYSMYENDPDHLVDWDFVEEVRLHVSESPSCPICLHPPVAAKVTRCGHIFCFSCILHYLALTDEKWRKCPICFDVITKADLKSVVTIMHKEFTSGQEIELKLMRRERETLIPIPASCFSPSLIKGPATLSSSEAVISYSKLIVASKSDVIEHVVGRELAALKCLLALEGDQPEACFIEEALSLVAGREALLSSESLSSDGGVRPSNFAVGEDGSASSSERSVIDCEAEGGSSPGLGALPSLLSEDNNDTSTPLANLAGSEAKGAPKSTFYFYQESSGAHVYLHALNVHMLERDFGSLDRCPSAIRAKVLEKESDSMSEGLRTRLRYLRHLPLSCPFDVVEVEMKEAVSELTLVEFQGQLDQRERKRRRRAKEEHRIEERVRVEEDRMMGRSRGTKINMSSFRHFPTFSEEQQQQRSLSSMPSHSEDDSFSTSSVSSSFTEDVSDSSPLSFAQMIRGGNRKVSSAAPSEAFPLLGRPSALGYSLPASHQDANAGLACRRGESKEEEEEEDECERVPAFYNSFSDDLAKALDEVRSKPASAHSGVEESLQRGKKGKKKKKKGIVLLSSGGF